MPFFVDFGEHVAPGGLGDAAIEPALQRREFALDDCFGALGQLARNVFFGAPQTRTARAANAAACAAVSSPSAIGFSNRRRNEDSEPSKPGSTNAKIDHRSRSEFSTGVPVSARR